MGVQGNEQGDQCCTARSDGATVPLPSVRGARSAQDVWQELGLEELSECDQEPKSVWAGMY